MRVFVTGATGYIGGAIAVRLLEAGHVVRGLVRDPGKADAARALGIDPVAGSLDDLETLATEARAADAVINAASSDHRPAVDSFLGALAGSGKPFIHTSGTSVVADEAAGEPSDRIFRETTSFEPVPERVARVALDRAILAAGAQGLRPVVLCNSLIYGQGPGLHQESVQVPTLVERARKTGVPQHIGRGLNTWSTVHVEDVAEIYRLALENPGASGFFFVENGEATYRGMAVAIGEALGLAGEPQIWPVDEAIAELGRAKALFTMSSNSRVRSDRTRRELGWAPRHGSVLDWIRKAVR